MTVATQNYRERCAEFLRAQRETKGLTLLDVSERSGLRIQYISDCEHALRNVGLDNLERLFLGLGIVVGDSTQPSIALRTRFAKNMRTLRDEQGLSQEALASLSGVHRTFVSMVERGVRNITIDNVERLAQALRVSEEVLLGLG